MSKFLERALVVLRAAPTYLVAAAVLLPLVAADLAAVMPGQAEDITRIALVVAGWLTGAVTIIRRVAPVPKTERGLL